MLHLYYYEDKTTTLRFKLTNLYLYSDKTGLQKYDPAISMLNDTKKQNLLQSTVYDHMNWRLLVFNHLSITLILLIELFNNLNNKKMKLLQTTQITHQSDYKFHS